MIGFEIFKFELKYRAKRLDSYLYFVVLFVFSMFAFEFIFEGQSIGLLKKNAPVVIAKVMAFTTGIFMIIISMIMGVPVIRDYEHNTVPIFFVNPIKKRDYLLGRFLGSLVILTFIFSGLMWGAMIGTLMPWSDPEHLLPFNYWNYLKPFLVIVLPTLFFGGSLFFVSGTLSRNLIVVYTQGVVFFLFFILSRNIENAYVAAILEPFGTAALTDLLKNWTQNDLNEFSIPLDGVLLYNRVFWILIGFTALMIGYLKFDFNILKESFSKKEKKKKQDKIKVNFTNIIIPKPIIEEGLRTSFVQFKTHTSFYFKSIFKEVSFWSIVICAILIILINSINLGTSYGVDSLPASYLIIEELQESSIFFFLIILLFYSGELIWKERDAKLDLIYDSLPVSDFVNLTSKFVALCLIYWVLLSLLILTGVLFQSFNGYFDYAPKVYFVGFFLEIFPFLVMYTFLSFFIQVMVNSKFISYLLVMLLFIGIIALSVLGFDHGLVSFSGGSLGKYSEMNGYGHFLKPYLCYQAYWLAFCIILFVGAVGLVVRGKETSIKKRMRLIKERLTKPLINTACFAFLLFVFSGSYIFYNTNVLNDFKSTATRLELRAEYEKILKSFQNKKNPTLLAVDLKLDLFPSKRAYDLECVYTLKNNHSKALDKVYLQKSLLAGIELDTVYFDVEFDLDDKYRKQGFYIYHLAKQLQTGDSIQLFFKQNFTTTGFLDGNSNTGIVYNGTFLGNHHFPKLGYNQEIELQEAEERKEFDLPLNPGLLPIDSLENKISSYQNTEIDFQIIVSTGSTQTAVAPGHLQKRWRANGRNFFSYKADRPMLNLYSITSAEYEVLQDEWMNRSDSFGKKVDLEIFYHKGHDHNLGRMMEAMKMSLEYYSRNFGPYQFKQMRINEFPRYREFAQSFPNSIPFSEAIGFILDIDDEEDVDLAFFITAHELAHQWWGHQVMIEEVQGWPMIIESLSQYSALLVLKEKYPMEKVQQLLQYEMENYLKERSIAEKPEVPLAIVGDEDYIFYRKGAINLFAFQDYVGENNVNLALSRFIKDWNTFDGIKSKERYATTDDLLQYFREVTPDSLVYIISDLFETVMLYENKAMTASYRRVGENKYALLVEVEAQKYQLDSVGNEVVVPINDWIDIGVYAERLEGEKELIYLEKHKVTSANQSFEILLGEEPVSAGIDPLGKLIDKKMEDNVVDCVVVENK